ncbi:unnamed protein product [Caenorhabditis auriculariae]|uniref:EGF-like domain-containing protein n=1 Tax=Caenorhabditis auriculariae TaxID=2777116 RepID=A0A8S1GPK5_9PELO|nr:unnamed protein product [Caenorhabditis auriculariae]
MCVGKTFKQKGRCVRPEESVISAKEKLEVKVDLPVKLSKIKVAEESKTPGSPCSGNDVCSGGSRCESNFCVCNEYEVIINNRCVGSHAEADEVVEKLAISAPGQACQPGTNCTGGSVCIESFCRCERGYILPSGVCSEDFSPSSAETSPGSLCTLTMQCPFRTQCVKGVCRCKQDETIVDNTCRKAINKIMPGSTCDPKKGYDCVGESLCLYGVCTCMNPLFSNGKECVTIADINKVEPGKRCLPSDHCSGGSFCAFDGVCRCPINEVSDVNKKCVKKSSVVPVQNKEFNNFWEATTVNSMIVAPPMIHVDYSHFPEKINEMEKLEMDLKNNMISYNGGSMGITASKIEGHTCTENSQCPLHSFCFENLCNCMSGFRAGAGFCEPIIKVGESCINTNQCEGHAVCLFGICTCTRAEPNGCEKLTMTHPGENCTMKNNVCSYNSYCSLMSGVCECPSGMATTNKKCEQTVESPGNACVTSRNCHKFSYCDNGYCICKDGYALINNFCLVPPIIEPFETTVPMPANRNDGPNPPIEERLKQDFAALGANIFQNNFVTPFSPPIQKITMHSFENSLPAPEPQLLQPIVESSAIGHYAVPIAQSAPIVSGDKALKADNEINNAVKVSLPGEYCQNGIICLGNSICRKHFCRCPQGTAAENGICTSGESSIRYSAPSLLNHGKTDFADERQFSLPLENCQNFEHCLGDSECASVDGLGMICQCLHPKVLIEDECVELEENKELVGIGEKCDESSICIGGSNCNMGLCECGAGRRLILGICIKTAMPGDDCSTGEICLDGSFCSGPARVCICPIGSKAKKDKCLDEEDLEKHNDEREMLLTAGQLPGDACGSHAKCTDNSFCNMDGICQCAQNFTNFEKKCVPANMVQHPGQECDDGTICSSGSYCYEGICTCQKGKLLIGSECLSISKRVARKQPNVSFSTGQCRDNMDCPTSFICLDQLCVCHGNSVDCLSLMYYDTEPECEIDAECGENSFCEEKVCICRKGYARNNETKCEEVRSVNPGSSCDEVRRCDHDAICYQGFCVCSYEDIVKEDHCVARDFNIGFGDRCSNTYRCMDQFVCVGGVCSCKFGDVSCNPNEPVTSPPGGSCSGARECTGGSVCKEGWCICPDPSMIVNKGICVQSGPKPTLPPKNSMTFAPQTSAPIYQSATTMNIVPTYRPTVKPVPVSNYQQPQKPIVPSTQGRKTVPGSQCGPLDVCVGGSQCIDGLCLCPAGTIPSQNGRCEKPTTTATRPLTHAQPPGTFAVATTTHTTYSSADLLSRRPPAFIELPTHAPLTTPNQDECAAIGLICKGNTVCRNKSCQCPEGHVLHHDGCVSPEEAERRKARGKARHQAVTQGATVFARPLGDCSLGQICTGGSQCSQRSICECPSEKPELRNGECSAPIQKVEAGPGESCDETKTCTRGSNCVSGQCRCQPGYIAISGSCVTLPMPTTPKMVVYAKPLESCDNGEICEGGASCDDDTGICMCPRGQVVFGTQCMPPPTQPQTSAASTTRAHPPVPVITPAPSVYSTECETDANCGDNKMCMMGRCKCKAGFVDNNGQCEPLEAIDAVERPVPVSYAKHKVETLSSERIHAREEEEEEEEKETTTRRATTRAPARQETQKPRIVGPPIRRPKPKNKGGSGGGTPTGNRGSGSYKTGGTGNGNCPPGNDPTRDDSGRLITCNGLEPNCPPRSYCYITSGGFATEEYNCCKSW